MNNTNTFIQAVTNSITSAFGMLRSIVDFLLYAADAAVGSWLCAACLGVCIWCGVAFLRSLVESFNPNKRLSFS